ncbi:C-X-C motif chemokine 10-like [Sphaeramia orbicularis]|uniref:C-X-C motif chemokine 10-like n=1 Tax=Sphaeramia orbicularis TaxID=375764 RepID=A0A673AGE3_9TELE|nr:C-X-C motif chemokine 10-like [Sphaeramia orbicularis]
MKLYFQSVCQLTFLGLCCVLFTVRESGSTFVPGRCVCPHSKPGVRGQLKDLTVYPKSPSCNKFTVIVTLKSNSEQVCINPEGPMGKQLIRCWKRAQKLGRNVKVCLRRNRRRGKGGRHHRSQQRTRGHNRRTSSSSSQ